MENHLRSHIIPTKKGIILDMVKVKSCEGINLLVKGVLIMNRIVDLKEICASDLPCGSALVRETIGSNLL